MLVLYNSDTNGQSQRATLSSIIFPDIIQLGLRFCKVDPTSQRIFCKCSECLHSISIELEVEINRSRSWNQYKYKIAVEIDGNPYLHSNFNCF